MATTKTIKLYQYSELSDGAKAKARDRWLAGMDVFELDHTISMIADAAGLLGFEGVDAKWFSWDLDRGSFFTFRAVSCRYYKGMAKAVHAEFPQDTHLHAVARDLQNLQRKHFYRIDFAVVDHGYYSQNKSFPSDLSLGWRVSIPDTLEGDVQETINDFCNWALAALREEYEYQTSEEAIADAMAANGYEFLENGEMY